ncbi:MAG: hypothetical protein ACFFEF_07445, partial [Candidatus Thorarchaeota archaeon]
MVNRRALGELLLKNLKYINAGLILIMLLFIPVFSILEFSSARISASVESRNPSPNHPDSYSLEIPRPSTSEINLINDAPTVESYEWHYSVGKTYPLPSGVQILGSASFYHHGYVHLQSLESLNFTGHISVLEGEVSIGADIDLRYDNINTEYILRAGEEIDFEVFLDREQISILTRDWIQECRFGIRLDTNTTTVVNLTGVKATGKTLEPLS